MLNLFLSWREDKPYPRTATIAKRVNIASRTVQRRIASLEQKGLIRREWGHATPDGTRTSTRYDLSGIVGKLGHDTRIVVFEESLVLVGDGFGQLVD